MQSLRGPVLLPLLLALLPFLATVVASCGNVLTEIGAAVRSEPCRERVQLIITDDTVGDTPFEVTLNLTPADGSLALRAEVEPAEPGPGAWYEYRWFLQGESLGGPSADGVSKTGDTLKLGAGGLKLDPGTYTFSVIVATASHEASAGARVPLPDCH